LNMKIAEFGEAELRRKAREVGISEIKTAKFQSHIKEMRDFLTSKKLGVGLAAPQVGKSLSLAIVMIQPTKHRPDAECFDLVIINPIIIKTYGNHCQMWEGCISGGPAKSSLFAKVPRYKKIQLKYLDENKKPHTKTFQDLAAQVIQHEVDHLNGIIFVDRVKDTKSYCTYRQYLKIIKRAKTKNAK